MTESQPKQSLNFIEQIIKEDLRTGKHKGRVAIRFPPEPNGYQASTCGTTFHKIRLDRDINDIAR